MRKHLLAAATAISVIAGSTIALAQSGGTASSQGTSTHPNGGPSAAQQGMTTSQGAGSLGAAADGSTTAGPATCGPGSTAPTTPCPPTVGGSTARVPGGAPDSGKSGVAQPPAAKGGESTE